MAVETIQAIGDVGVKLCQAWADAQVQVVNETFWAKQGPFAIGFPLVLIGLMIAAYAMCRLEKK